MTKQQETPIIAALRSLMSQPDSCFYAPGHKRGQGISRSLAALLGHRIFQADLPELPELDNLFAPSGVIEQSQQLAAELWGADHTWFLVNGTSCGMIAAILATCGFGDKIILPRNSHQSAIAGLILSGATPLFIEPAYNPQWDLAYGITPASLEKLLRKYTDTKAVLLLYPTYHGVGADIEAIADLTHRYQIPLIVDEAHGSHFSFHPDFPPSALQSGADISIQSTHKTLGALSQASMLHLRGTRISPQRISKALSLVQSTSPSYLLLASLDGARQQMALEGQALLTRTLNLAKIARDRLSQLAGIQVLTATEPELGFRWLDPTRLTIDVSRWGLTGFEVDEILRQAFQVTAELPTLRQLSFIISLGNTQLDIDQLCQAFTILSDRYTVSSRNSLDLPALPPSQLACSPREAYFAPTETVLIKDACDRVSAELICPYPPGIPVLIPGEIITQEALDYLRQVQQLGGMISGCSDDSLQTIRVTVLD
ncbi:MAG: aminotransferase class I/II-fold pyridoxal phosphate-dependent enzyme [Snowella sp.]|nr:aminotransferase class I/II-fold pyridoxal phosphate-dependent enzyme [Snowella sp.]